MPFTNSMVDMNQELATNLVIGLIFVGGILMGYCIGKGWMSSKKKTEVKYQ